MPQRTGNGHWESHWLLTKALLFLNVQNCTESPSNNSMIHEESKWLQQKRMELSDVWFIPHRVISVKNYTILAYILIGRYSDTKDKRENSLCLCRFHSLPHSTRGNRSVYYSSTPVLVCFKNAHTQTYTVLVIYSYSTWLENNLHVVLRPHF